MKTSSNSEDVYHDDGGVIYFSDARESCRLMGGIRFEKGDITFFGFKMSIRTKFCCRPKLRPFLLHSSSFDKPS